MFYVGNVLWLEESNSWFNIPKNFTGIARTRNGDMRWYSRGGFHRIDGPAIMDVDGYCEWHYMDRFYGFGLERPLLFPI